MIYIKIDNDVFYDDAVVLVRSFYPRTEVMALKADSKPEENDEILSIEVPDVTGLDKKNAHEVFKDSLYKKLSEKTGKKLPWGYLTGVRPSKIAYTMLEEGATEEQIKKHFMDKHYASEEKADLALTVAKKELDILTDMDYKTGYSLYIGIPFCPSICLYCSFSSYALGAYKDYVDNYVDALIKEIRFVAESMKGRRLDTVYMGGGTPTTLSAEQLDILLTVIERNFDLSTLREYTVEAGRPDTVTEAKLNTLMSHNVERISINPQTFSDDVLKAIGRKHTCAQTVEAYELARKVGFKNINMDFIAGLNSDTPESFKMSIDKAISLAPESITVHNLALKSAAFLCTENEFFDLTERSNAAKMVDYSYNTLLENGYNPYYMYRQSKSLGNLENVGYAKDGFDCLYNVFMMDETHTVLAAGAGAVTKLKDPKTAHIERIYNYKYPYEYLNNFDEVLSRKKGIIEFYGE